jgi:predicted enzyme related to lactoylglutathione lyase
VEIQVNIDCEDLDRMVEFYCAALGYQPEGSLEQHYRSITARDGRRPKLVFQKVPESKVVKNRVHLDFLVGDDYEAEATRWETLGATRVEQVAEAGLNWIVMRDPEGNEICVCDY